MSKTMQDKETKKRFENFVTEECGDSLWGNDGTDNYDTAYDVKDKVWGFISKLEQEAERRGYERGVAEEKFKNECIRLMREGNGGARLSGDRTITTGDVEEILSKLKDNK